jgi:hypothetical protein
LIRQKQLDERELQESCERKKRNDEEDNQDYSYGSSTRSVGKALTKPKARTGLTSKDVTATGQPFKGTKKMPGSSATSGEQKTLVKKKPGEKTSKR